MMISPATWREFFRPRLAGIIDAARAAKPDLRVIYHSDGHFEPILDDLVEIGIAGINPLQPEHMDAARIRRRFGPRLALWGTVGRQTTFAFAGPAEIRARGSRADRGARTGRPGPLPRLRHRRARRAVGQRRGVPGTGAAWGATLSDDARYGRGGDRQEEHTHGVDDGPTEAALGHDPGGPPALRPGAPAHRRDRRRDAGGPRHPRGDGLHEDRRHAGDHRPLHAPPADPRLRHLRVVAAPRGGRGLGDGGDPGHRARGDGRRRRVDGVRRAGLAGRAHVRACC